MEPLLRVHDLTVCYGSNNQEPLVALNSVSFDVVAGEAVGLLGESGCGKTTLALTLLNLLPPSGRVLRGSVVLRGISILKLAESQFQKVRGVEISMVHQEP